MLWADIAKMSENKQKMWLFFTNILLTRLGKWRTAIVKHRSDFEFEDAWNLHLNQQQQRGSTHDWNGEGLSHSHKAFFLLLLCSGFIFIFYRSWSMCELRSSDCWRPFFSFWDGATRDRKSRYFFIGNCSQIYCRLFFLPGELIELFSWAENKPGCWSSAFHLIFSLEIICEDFLSALAQFTCVHTDQLHCIAQLRKRIVYWDSYW